MKGLICQSTAVCLSHEQRSVAAPERMNKYVRLGEHRHHHRHRHHHHHAKNIKQPPISHHLFQVVVLRVSIHCQGCAAKLHKHLSKMQGVTSFSIDLESKMVKVAGHVSPSSVLESISKMEATDEKP
ncbi:heavy metal-associated isoprenylated plant protein 35-like isoform X2 [Salvia hispanica]|uniref:heavy metal-associated isoprenylated plant protein 35-like isoform X2 n=1 Tax=Salvia hispanica TaxID=49212 RepID=UPI002009B7B4|nr:heavy metal-associated isoprenylated plant protein 35-like isoform X2 [Salvia hispanica]